MLKMKIIKGETLKLKYNIKTPDIILANLQEKEVTPTKEEQLIKADFGYDGLKQVKVGEIPDNYIEPIGTKEIVENGIYEIKNYENVDVNVEYKVKLQQKNVEPTKELQEIIADETYDGLEKVNVMPIAEEYIIPSGELNINENGQYDVTDKSSVNVEIENTSGGNVDEYFNTSLSYTEDTFLPWNDTSTDYTYLVNEEHTKVIAGVSSSSIILVPIEEKDNYNTRWQITAYSSNWRIKNVGLGRYLRIRNATLELSTSAGNWTSGTTGKMYCTSNYTSYYLMVENDKVIATSTPANGQIFEAYIPKGTSMTNNSIYKFLTQKYIRKYPDIVVTNDVITTLDGMCAGYNGLIIPKIICGLNIEIMSKLYSNCTEVTEIDTSGLITDNVTNMSGVFYYCTSLKNIDVSRFNTSNVTRMDQMFYYCSALTSLDLSNFDTSNVTNMYQMFYNCKSLTHLDIRNFDFTNATDYGQMFGSSTSNYVPDNCEIIVKDDIAKEWLASNHSRLTNVKTIAEYEA